MAFEVRAFRVLIASPSDLAEERQIATNAINDWNAQNSHAELVVLLPVKWETHARPETGIRPQTALNRQLVDACDVLIGMFWTRIGTHTGVAESGTIEEINQFVAEGKPALLYFSKRPIDPDKIDLEQHRKLSDFKKETFSRALIGEFTSLEDLRNKLFRHLTDQVREFQKGRLASNRI